MGMLHPDQMRDIRKAEPGLQDAGSDIDLRFLDSIAERYFRWLDDGRRVFESSGLSRTAFVVETPKQEKALRRFVKAEHGAVLALAWIVILSLSDRILSLDLLPFAALLFFGWVPQWIVSRAFLAYITRGMERVDVPRSIALRWKAGARTLHPVLQVIFCLIMGAMSGAGFSIYVSTGDAKGILVGLIFLIPLVASIGGIWHRWLRS